MDFLGERGSLKMKKSRFLVNDKLGTGCDKQNACAEVARLMGQGTIKILQTKNHLELSELKPIKGFVKNKIGWTNQEPERDEPETD